MARHFCCRLTYGPTFSFAIYSTSAHRRRRCGVGCCGCCRGKNHLRMSAPPVRCRLLALEYKPRSCSPARPPRRHDFARHHTDLQPPNSGRTCLIWGSFVLFKNTKIIRQNENLNHCFTHHLSVWFLVQLPSIKRASGASCVRARAYSDWSPLTMPDHTALALCAFPQLGNSPLRFRRRTSFVPLVPPVLFVSTFAQTNSVCRSDFSVLYSPRASSRHRSLPSFLCMCTISDFFDVGLLICR